MLDTSTCAWVSAVQTAGGTVSPGQQTNVNNLIVCYKTASIFTLLDREWLYASENATQAGIDIINLSAHTLNGSITFTANQGFNVPSIGAPFIDTNYVSGTNYTLNANSFGAYVRTSRTSGGNFAAMGQDNGQGPSFFRPLNGSNNIEYDDNNGSFPSVANPASNAQGNYIFSRTSSTTINPYRNASALSAGSSTAFAPAFPTLHWYALAYNASGTVGSPTTDQVASIFMGGALNGTQSAAKNSCLNTYMTAIGANVY